MMYYLYKITNNISGKYYIGVHKTASVNDRYMGSGIVLRQAFEKYGIENFSKEILEYLNTTDDMYRREKEVVTEEVVADPKSYNMKVGGTGGFDYVNSTGKNVRNGYSHSDDTKLKISTNKPPPTLEQRNLAALRAKKLMSNPLIVEKMKNSLTGKEKAVKHKDNIRKALLGHKHETVSCPKCGKQGANNAMKRWHFDNCRQD